MEANQNLTLQKHEVEHMLEENHNAEILQRGRPK